MTVVRIYRMTISSTWYDHEAQKVQEYEMHYKVARRGTIRSTRRYLAKRCVPHFQQNVYRLYKRWPRKRKVRGAFEREQPILLTKSERMIHIEVRRMEGKGKRWKAYPLPSRVLTYVKKKRKRKRKSR